MESVPALSVVVRTLGSSGRLTEALESLAGQTWRDFEVVVVDMSDGRIEDALEFFASRLPGLRRIALSRRVPRPAALNAGVSAARAPLIGILDDDNLYDPPQLERLISGLMTTGAGYVYTGVRHATYTKDSRRVACREVSIPWRFDRVLLGNYVYATGSAYRKSLWERIGGYDERFTVFEDWDFIIRAAQEGALIHLPIVSGESRKFTGIDGVANFDLEIQAVRGCLAGIYWKHRRFFRGDLRRELKVVSADHCRRRLFPRTGVLTRSIGGWRLELVWDLLAWWSANLASFGRRSAT